MRRIATTLLLIVFPLLLGADVPLGELNFDPISNLQFIAIEFPVFPGFPLPGILPPELQISGLIVSIENSDPTITAYRIGVIALTSSGETRMLNGFSERGPDDFTPVVVEYPGADGIVALKFLSILPTRSLVKPPGIKPQSSYYSPSPTAPSPRSLSLEFHPSR